MTERKIPVRRRRAMDATAPSRASATSQSSDAGRRVLWYVVIFSQPMSLV